MISNILREARKYEEITGQLIPDAARFNPAENKLQLWFNEGTTLITETAIDLQPGETYSFIYIQEGPVGIFYIDGIASLTVRLYGASGKPIQLFTENNGALFTSLRQYTRP